MQILKKITIALAACAMSSLALAQVVVPTYTSFGVATVPHDFGGTGIPTNQVASTTFGGTENDPRVSTMYLSATPRYSSPALTTDGAGTFFAQPGANGEGNTFDHENLSQWNFSWEITRIPESTAYTYKLFVDLNKGVGTDFSSYLGYDLPSENLPLWDSSNLGFWGNVNVFNPNAVGEYGFVLQAYDAFGNVAATTAILVEVGAADGTVPEPASIALVGLALGAAGFASRRRKAA